MHFSKILLLTGPTASGKSALALSIAQKSGGVIINADSQQLYRDLPILTARPTSKEEERAAHKLYGILGPQEQCSAGQWLKLARMEIDWALSKGLLPIVVGGTGFYLKALLQGIAAIPDISLSVRAQATNDYEAMGKEAFVVRLKEVDNDFFQRLKVYDKQRLIRAYEVWLGTGKSLSWWQGQPVSSPYPPDYFSIYYINIARDLLYERCNQRFTAMIEAGAVEEVKALLPTINGVEGGITKVIGVTELSAYLNQEISLHQAIMQAQQATRNYAKRQLTWFRHQLSYAQKIDFSASFQEYDMKAAKILNSIDQIAAKH